MNLAPRNFFTASGLLLPLLISLSALMMPVTAYTQAAPEGWIDQRAEPVTPEAAQAVIAEREQALAQQRSQKAQQQSQQTAIAGKSAAITKLAVPDTAATSAALVSAATEFTQLAAALDNDPRRIYQPGRVGNAFLPTAFIGKWWANDKAVCPPYLAGTGQSAAGVRALKRQCPRQVSLNGNRIREFSK